MSMLERSSSHTNGAVISDSQRIGRDIDDRDRLGRAQRDLLRNDFADHQRDVSGEDDHQAEPHRVRRFRLEAEQLQALRAGSPRLAPEKAPAKIAISVIPLCTVDRNRPGRRRGRARIARRGCRSWPSP